MNQKDKEVLLAALISRFPYNVQVLTDLDETFDGGAIGIITKIETYRGSKYPSLIGQKLFYTEGCLTPFTVDEIRPYLRPMSSMTKDEVLEYISLKESIIAADGITYSFETHRSIDWLNAHHFDYEGLIDKGLAIEAPERMYK